MDLKLRIWRALRSTQRWLEARLVFAILAVLRLLPPDGATNALAALSRRIGPLFGRHRVAMQNLKLAFPEKTEAERRAIALDMWDSMSRLAAEYVFLDDIFDYDPQAESSGRIEVKGEEIFERIRAEGKPCIFFTAHTGNFELLPICAATFDLEVTSLFRAPNNPLIAKRLAEARRTRAGHLVPSKAGAAWALARALDGGRSVGMLVDQKYKNGVAGSFFGQPVRTNPLLPKLVRQYGCDVYPARCVRLPGNRFRLELEEKLEVPRTADGAVDIAAACQRLNDKVEAWVREYPGQWMWFHKRFKL